MASSKDSDFDPYASIQELMGDESLLSMSLEERLRSLSRYSKIQQNTFLVLLSEGLIGNGGAVGLFCNDGCIAPAVADAYQDIGACGHAKQIRLLIARFGDQYPMDLDQINERLGEISESEWEEATRFFNDQQNFELIYKLIENQHA